MPPTCKRMRYISPDCVYLQLIPFSAITCDLLSLDNGVISYSPPDTEFPLRFGTLASHECFPGFSLVGTNMRTCDGNGSSASGMWTGKTPICQRKLNYLLIQQLS